jgi:hypothetical protein
MGSDALELEPDPPGPFDDLLSDMLGTDERDWFTQNVKARWKDLVRPADEAGCRQVLVELVEENLAHLNVIRQVHANNTEEDAERAARRLRSESNRDAEDLRRHAVRCVNTLSKVQAVYRKLKARGAEDRPVDRQPDRQPIDRRPSVPHGDIEWTKVYPVDVSSCGGFLPERCVDGVAAGFKEGVDEAASTGFVSPATADFGSTIVASTEGGGGKT